MGARRGWLKAECTPNLSEGCVKGKLCPSWFKAGAFSLSSASMDETSNINPSKMSHDLPSHGHPLQYNKIARDRVWLNAEMFTWIPNDQFWHHFGSFRGQGHPAAPDDQSWYHFKSFRTQSHPDALNGQFWCHVGSFQNDGCAYAPNGKFWYHFRSFRVQGRPEIQIW